MGHQASFTVAVPKSVHRDTMDHNYGASNSLTRNRGPIGSQNGSYVVTCFAIASKAGSRL